MLRRLFSGYATRGSGAGGRMTLNDVKEQAFSMPLCSPSYPLGPYRFINREYLIISYKTDPDALRHVVPEPLEIDYNNPIVKYEFINMSDSSGFGSYTESGQVIPASFKGKSVGFVQSMYLDIEPPIAGGRELWGFPKKIGTPVLRVDKDTLCGTLKYGGVRIAQGSMGYKHKHIDQKAVAHVMAEPNVLLKSFPHVDGKPRILQLVEYNLVDVHLKGAWRGPAALELHPHALAPVADLPVREVIDGVHIIADLTLGQGRVIHDYLK